MARYIFGRLREAFVILIVIISIVFVLLRMMPMEGYLGDIPDEFTEEQIQNIYRSMGLLDPIHVQLGNFYLDLLQGNFGESITFRPNVDVADIIAPKIPYSFAFGFAAFILTYLVGVPVGILMATYKGKLADKLGNAYVILINAVPGAIYFLFLQVYVTELFKIPMLFQLENPKTWILPAVCMSLGGIAANAMWMRRFMVDELNKDYIKLARAKGMKSSKIMYAHVMRNAFVPMAHNLPLRFLLLIGGSIYIENLYSIPGMGGLLVTAIQVQDNPLVQTLVLIFSSIGVIGLLLGDLLMIIIDPRIKLVRGGTR